MKKLLCVVAAVLFTSPVFAAGGGGERSGARGAWHGDGAGRPNRGGRGGGGLV